MSNPARGGARGGAIILFEHVQEGGMGGGNHLFHTCSGVWPALARSGRGGYHFFNISRGWQGAGATNCLKTCREVAGAGGNFIGILPGGGVGRWAKGPFSRGGKKYPKNLNKSFFD